MRFLVPGTEEEARHRADVLARAVHDPAARAQVDSGRLAEPFWYVDSPLTTPDPRRPFAGRPARGDVPEPAPGILVPDCPVTVPGRPEVVAAAATGPVGVHACCSATTRRRRPDAGRRTCPSRCTGCATSIPGPTLREALGARPDETWVLRPDAHVAAVVTSPADVAQLRCRGLTPCPRPPAGRSPAW